MRRHLVALCALALGLAPACAKTQDAAFTLEVGPQFVNGAVPGSMTSLLVSFTETEHSDDPVRISASSGGAAVTVVPQAITAGSVAEVRVIADSISAGEAIISVAITGTRGDHEQTETREITVFDWDDDRGPQARALLEVFLDWLAEHRPDLGLTPQTPVEGSMVAPGLLVVSHYCFMSEHWEIGLSWHIMIPPDDWAEIYLRPVGTRAPTLAFRLASQQAALDAGDVAIVEVAAPEEVAR